MKMESNVREYEQKFMGTLGNYESEGFSMQNFFVMDKYKISSPIEQILYMALVLVRRTSFVGDGNRAICGVSIMPQFRVGKYKVDFKISYLQCDISTQTHKSIIIECDSQEFHDTNEPHRRYEKERDRFLQKEGYKVFRYTGAEICKDPYTIAAEIISFITGKPQDEIEGSYINYICTN